MTFRFLFTIVVFSLFFVGCKTQSSIVTSKNEAEKLGIYKVPNKKAIAKSKKNEPSKIEVSNKKSKIKDNDESDYIASSDTESYLADQLVNKGLEFIGTPYRTGGTSTSGMDCSGFIIATFSNYSLKLPRTSNEMSRTGEEINKSNARKGDLIFFRTNGRSVINHVGMIVEVLEDEIKFIHSSTQRGVIVSSTKEGYYKNTFAQINRVIE